MTSRMLNPDARLRSWRQFTERRNFSIPTGPAELLLRLRENTFLYQVNYAFMCLFFCIFQGVIKPHFALFVAMSFGLGFLYMFFSTTPIIVGKTILKPIHRYLLTALLFCGMVYVLDSVRPLLTVMGVTFGFVLFHSAAHKRPLLNDVGQPTNSMAVLAKPADAVAGRPVDPVTKTTAPPLTKTATPPIKTGTPVLVRSGDSALLEKVAVASSPSVSSRQSRTALKTSGSGVTAAD